MKKIMMFLMLSVFFLMGGMTNGFAQKKAASESEPQVILSPPALQVFPGATVRMEFKLSANIVNESSYLICLYIQRPGQTPVLLVVIDQRGGIVFKHPTANRITVSYGGGATGTVTISYVRDEDTGDYYVSASYKEMWYFSNATRLEVLIPWRDNKS